MNRRAGRRFSLPGRCSFFCKAIIPIVAVICGRRRIGADWEMGLISAEVGGPSANARGFHSTRRVTEREQDSGPLISIALRGLVRKLGSRAFGLMRSFVGSNCAPTATIAGHAAFKF